MAGIRESLEGVQRMRSPAVGEDSHHYIVLSQLHRWLAARAVPYARGVLLDYGCGGQPYRALFADRISRYIGADVASAEGVQLDVELTPGAPAPLPDGSVDTVLSTQTLEHVFDFHGYLADCHRLLIPGGRLIITVPMQWRHHEGPYDFWRFTRFGLERKLLETGFQPLETVPCGGVYSLLGQVYLNHLAARNALRPALARLVNRLALFCDRRRRDTEDTLLWMCLAEKQPEGTLSRE